MLEGPKKEIIIAIFVGLITGVFFSYVVFYLAKKPIFQSFKKAKPTAVSLSPTASLERKVDHLVIDSPLNEALTLKPKITLSGKTPKGSLLFVISEKSEEVIELSFKETFNMEIELLEGENQINVMAILKDGKEESESFTVVYQKE